MIPDIGLLIGAYTFTRLLSFVMRRGEREEHVAVKVFAILGMIGTVICTAPGFLDTRGGHQYSRPTLERRF